MAQTAPTTSDFGLIGHRVKVAIWCRPSVSGVVLSMDGFGIYVQAPDPQNGITLIPYNSVLDLRIIRPRSEQAADREIDQ